METTEGKQQKRGILKSPPEDTFDAERRINAIGNGNGGGIGDGHLLKRNENVGVAKKTAKFVNVSNRENEDSKRVLFANACQCNVFDVRKHFECSLNAWPCTGCVLFRGLALGNREIQLNPIRDHEQNPTELVKCFNNPGDEPGFHQRFEERTIIVERCYIKDAFILGMIKTKNLEKKKYVFVRYTTDEWTTCVDTPAKVIPNNDLDDKVSYFAFEVEFTEDMTDNDFEFVVCCRFSYVEYWDNNGGQKYRVQRKI